MRREGEEQQRKPAVEDGGCGMHCTVVVLLWAWRAGLQRRRSSAWEC
jgi:hypothetical protein